MIVYCLLRPIYLNFALDFKNLNEYKVQVFNCLKN